MRSKEISDSKLFEERLLYVMGVLQFVPLVIGWEGREFLLFHLCLWLPLGIYRYKNNDWTSSLRLLVSERLVVLVFLWFSWGILSGSLACLISLISGDKHALVRLMSVGVLFIYGAAPLAIGIAIGESSYRAYFHGMAIGLLGTCLGYCIIYFFGILVAPDYVRLAIGQRVPVVLLFAVPLLVLLSIRSFPFRTVLLFLLTLVIWLSMTRAGVLGWCIGVLFAIYFLARQNWKQACQFGVAMAIAVIFSMQAGFIGTRLENIIVFKQNSIDGDGGEGIKALLENIFAFRKNENGVIAAPEIVEDSAATRLLIWKVAIETSIESPVTFLTGHGQLGASYLLRPIKSANGSLISDYSAHSEYFDQLLRGGVIGLVLVFAIILELIRRGWRARHSSNDFHTLQLALGIATLAISGYGVFHETTRYPWLGVVFWTTVGICLGRQVSLQKRSQVSEST